MASNNNSKQGGGKAGDEELDPKFEWIDNANNFLLRLTLTGFKKEDFRVQVDGTGKLTVRGQRPPAASSAGGKHTRFHKVFQLPSNANIDDITGRFEANVLTITVPKRPATTTAPPTTVQEIKHEADGEKKKKLQEEEAIAKHKPATTERKEQQVVKPAEPAAAPPPGHVVDRESLAEKVKRRAEEESAKAAEAAEEKTATALGRWRERVAGELEHLADMRWAEGVVDTARRNKDVIATAVAAFSLGFFVSHKLFCRR
uniref:SHSP domain-containing protein n=1 Tax=Oryza punctata TaxID=4537 RepID=A0A0E0L6I4_ORYPU